MIEDLSLRRAIEFAIQTEKQGAEFYDRMAKKFADNEELKEIFSILARDEEIHEFQFQRLLKELPFEERGELSEDEVEYLRAVSAAEVFYGHHAALDSADTIESREDALQRAHEMERSTLLYYRAMKDIVGPNPVLDEIIGMEKQHLVQVMRCLVSGSKMRSLLDSY
jgi:rubrerythrin